MSKDKNVNNESKGMNQDKWFKPKKFIPINYFFKACGNKSEGEKNNNKYVALVDNDEIEEEATEEIKVKNDESKMIKEEVGKNNKKMVKIVVSKRIKAN